MRTDPCFYQFGSWRNMLQTWLKEDRFYNVQLQANLFGGTSVLCSWGSRYGKRGGYKIIFCDSELEVNSALQVIEKRRRARGYKFTEQMLLVVTVAMKGGCIRLSQCLDVLLSSAIRKQLIIQSIFLILEYTPVSWVLKSPLLLHVIPMRSYIGIISSSPNT